MKNFHQDKIFVCVLRTFPFPTGRLSKIHYHYTFTGQAYFSKIYPVLAKTHPQVCRPAVDPPKLIILSYYSLNPWKRGEHEQHEDIA